MIELEYFRHEGKHTDKYYDEIELQFPYKLNRLAYYEIELRDTLGSDLRDETDMIVNAFRWWKDDDHLDFVFKSFTDSNWNIPTLTVIAKWDEVEITNSYKMHHTMRDVFVVFIFKVKLAPNGALTSKFCLSNMYLYRGTITLSEYIYNYLFSHYVDSSGFCFGNTDLYDLAAMLKDTVTEEQLKLFMLSFDQYLQWESLKGVPYKHLEYVENNGVEKSYNITPSLRRGYINMSTHDFVANIVNDLVKSGDINPKRLQIEFNGYVDVRMNEYLYNVLFNRFKSESTHSMQLFVKKDNPYETICFKVGNRPNIEDATPLEYYFKGEYHMQMIIMPDDDIEDLKPPEVIEKYLVLRPEILNLACTILNILITKQLKDETNRY